MSFSKDAGHLFRPIAADDQGQTLVWDSEFSFLLDLEPELAGCLAVPVFDNGGARVVFSKFERGKDVLLATRGLDEGARLPRSLYRKLCDAEERFRCRIESVELSESQQGFARSFVLPDPTEFPAAYRVRKAGLFSRKKLYVLWGLVPESPRAQPTLRMGMPYVPGQEDGALGRDDDAALTMRGDHPEVPPADAIVYDEESDLPRWLQWLIWILGSVFLLAILWLLFSLLLKGCDSSESQSNPVVVRTLPPAEKRDALLEQRSNKLRQEPDHLGKEGQLRAIENARKRQQAAADSAEAARRADTFAKEAESNAQASKDPEVVRNSEKLRREAELQKDNSIKDQKDADRAFRSPQESDRLDKLKRARPEEQKELRSKFYVTPKASGGEGEILVRRFKPDEIVPGEGLRMHLEAEANGRRDFRVKGWRLGLSPLVETERLEQSLPLRPEIDVPLELTFEYRGDDGEIHEDVAPFTIKGGFEIIPHIEIEVFEPEKIPSGSDKSPTPAPPVKADPKKFG